MEKLIKHSSSIGVLQAHLSFKTKYTHKVFDIEDFRTECENLFREIVEKNKYAVEVIGFDSNHIHMDVDVGLSSLPEIVKKFKGISGRKLLQKFPDIKKKYFHGSGLWSPAYYFHGVGRDSNQIIKYISKQKFSGMFADKNQTTLASFAG